MSEPSTRAPKVFVSYCSVDRPRVVPMVAALRAAGLDVWFDEDVAGGDNAVRALNAALAQCDVGVVALSASTPLAPWHNAEIDALTHHMIAGRKLVIPVTVDESPVVPELIKPLSRLRVHETDRLVDAILHRRPPRASGDPLATTLAHRVGIQLVRADSAIRVLTVVDGSPVGAIAHAGQPAALQRLCAEHRAGFRAPGIGSRSPIAVERVAREPMIADLGRELARFCFEPSAVGVLTALLDGDGLKAGGRIELAFDSTDPELLALPFEALRFGDRLLVGEPAVTMVRRPGDLPCPWTTSPAWPLKVLVAVGAPDEGKTQSNPLDHERELNNILDAVELAARRGEVEVRILEASDPATIRAALAKDQYHVLYVTGHGRPGALELDDEDGEAVEVPARRPPGDRRAVVTLGEALRQAGRAAPIVFLNTCHGAADGTEAGTAATAGTVVPGGVRDGVARALPSLAEELLRSGVPAVIAMQTSVSDAYGTALAAALFEILSSVEGATVSAALAQVRRGLEARRQERLSTGAVTGDALDLPEYATATVLVAGLEAPVVNRGGARERLTTRSVHHLGGGRVPQLGQDELIGRRREVRQALWVLRAPAPGSSRPPRR